MLDHKWNSKFVTAVFAGAFGILATGLSAQRSMADDFNWKAHSGETVSFLASTNPWTSAVMKYKGDFEKLTGITLRVDTYSEEQMRQRLVTVMNARSNEVDLFMTQVSREGMQFAAAGWYRDLMPLAKKETAPGYELDDLSPALVKAATFDGALVGIPLNIAGPVIYYRTDIFEKCQVSPPGTIDDIAKVAAKIKKCDPSVTAFASRGLKPALPYTFSVLLHNMGGSYMKDGKSNLCSPEGKKALRTYAGLLKDYGPPGVVNYNFYQLTSLYRAGRSAMSFESSNELSSIMENEQRLGDTGVMPLPKGPGGSHPITIGWSLAISKFSSNPDAAWYFVQWATSPKMQAKLALAGIAPPRKSASSDQAYKTWLDKQPVRKQWQQAIDFLAANGNSDVAYPIAQNPVSRQIIGQAVDSILLGTASVDEACKTADEKADALIAQQ
ncbi:ABC transporter substrate-binding protein [Pararhizobium mangrovi]|uniref:Sugar ABC transporter substrate-binding protein n=1 Tax=Pararhizobium mangrovi TaxID=2590452 RepID=A0A506UF82_9HYPH|nr:sugar ABC transporter substrate-binding protein [Pararhizobium mangrovi]TPW31881.1 sugar ABC transporter substrate-binding protein [Pararhizobium mangrovi]